MEAQIEEQNKNISALQKQLAEEMAKSRLAANSSWRDISEVSFTEDDRYLLANLIYCEAGGEPYDGQVAVGAVVINRVLSSVYPSTLLALFIRTGSLNRCPQDVLLLPLRKTGRRPAATGRRMRR